jgi:hypothetical protein
MVGTMPYEYNMSSNDPGCIIVMIDQSGSMNDKWGRSKYKLSWGAARAVNHMIGELIERCRKGDDVAPRVRLGFYGYSNEQDVDWAAKKFLPDADGLVSLVDLAECEDVVEDDENEILLPWIVEEQAYGRTPMRTAFQQVLSVAENFAQNHPDSFPPVIVNITDGIPTDCDESELEAIVKPLMNIDTNDGAALVFNLHISPDSSNPSFLPSPGDALPNSYAKYLFAASSVLPESMAEIGRVDHGMNIGEGARCFAFNADSAGLVKLLSLASSGGGGGDREA